MSFNRGKELGKLLFNFVIYLLDQGLNSNKLIKRLK